VISDSRIPIVVDSRLRIPEALLSEELAAALREEFSHKNPDHERERRRLDARSWSRGRPTKVPATIETWRLEGDDLTLPRGGLSRARTLLEEHGLGVRTIDHRSEGTGPRPVGYALRGITPFPFQEEMFAAGAKTQNCILRGEAGAGKTIVAEMLIARFGLCSLVIVPNQTIFDQWKTRLVDELGLRPDDVGVIQGKRAKIRPITIAMVQTFAKRAKEFAGVFGVLIFDEVHRAAAETFYPAVDGSDAKYRIGVSDDERRKDKKEFLTADVFGRVAYETNRKELVAAGVIMDTEVRLVPTLFEAPWFVELDHEQRQDPTIYDRLMREMVGDAERNRIATDLIVECMREGSVALGFSHRVEHCLGLRSDVVASDPRIGVIVGDAALKQEAAETIKGIKSGSIVAAIGTYQSIGTGVDLPAADRGVAITPIYTNRSFFKQVRGRVRRVDRRAGAKKKDSILYVLWDRAVHGLVPLRNYLKWNDKRVKVRLDDGSWEDGRAFLKQAEAEEDVAEES
jgi:superfamily II DNA or RNA helicase